MFNVKGRKHGTMLDKRVPNVPDVEVEMTLIGRHIVK